MQSYENKDSGISRYEIEQGSIRIEFKTGEVYLYTEASAGPKAILRMHQLACAGEGLNTYINVIKPKHALRVRGKNIG